MFYIRDNKIASLSCLDLKGRDSKLSENVLGINLYSNHQVLNSVMERSYNDSFHCVYYCSVATSCPTLCDPMGCSIPGFSVLHYLQKGHNICNFFVQEVKSVFTSLETWLAESCFGQEILEDVNLHQFQAQTSRGLEVPTLAALGNTATITI